MSVRVIFPQVWGGNIIYNTYFTVKQSEGHTESENRELICGDGSQSEGEEEEMVIRSVSA